MKLSTGENSGSFYESFSDLIFATMAIFVLLMLVFLVQVNANVLSQEEADDLAAQIERVSEELDESRQDAAAAQERAEEAEANAEAAKRESEDAEQRAAEAEQKAGDLLPKPIDLVIAIDGSSSMRDLLKQVETAAVSAAEIAARLSPRFRIGVVVYRDRARTTASGEFTFPLTHVAQTVRGRRHRGMNALREFLQEETLTLTFVDGGSESGGGTSNGRTGKGTRLSALYSIADVENALDIATSLFDPNADAETRRVLVVMGDVGPWEVTNPESYRDPQDAASKAACLRIVRDFASRSERVRVLSVFTGITAAHQRWHQSETKRFFKELAEAAGPEKGEYSEDVSSVSAMIVEAVVGESGQG